MSPYICIAKSASQRRQSSSPSSSPVPDDTRNDPDQVSVADIDGDPNPDFDPRLAGPKLTLPHSDEMEMDTSALDLDSQDAVAGSSTGTITNPSAIHNPDHDPKLITDSTSDAGIGESFKDDDKEYIVLDDEGMIEASYDLIGSGDFYSPSHAHSDPQPEPGPSTSSPHSGCQALKDDRERSISHLETWQSTIAQDKEDQEEELTEREKWTQWPTTVDEYLLDQALEEMTEEEKGWVFFEMVCVEPRLLEDAASGFPSHVFEAISTRSYAYPSVITPDSDDNSSDEGIYYDDDDGNEEEYSMTLDEEQEKDGKDCNERQENGDDKHHHKNNKGREIWRQRMEITIPKDEWLLTLCQSQSIPPESRDSYILNLCLIAFPYAQYLLSYMSELEVAKEGYTASASAFFSTATTFPPPLGPMTNRAPDLISSQIPHPRSQDTRISTSTRPKKVRAKRGKVKSEEGKGKKENKTGKREKKRWMKAFILAHREQRAAIRENIPTTHSLSSWCINWTTDTLHDDTDKGDEFTKRIAQIGIMAHRPIPYPSPPIVGGSGSSPNVDRPVTEHTSTTLIPNPVEGMSEVQKGKCKEKVRLATDIDIEGRKERADQRSELIRFEIEQSVLSLLESVTLSVPLDPKSGSRPDLTPFSSSSLDTPTRLKEVRLKRLKNLVHLSLALLHAPSAVHVQLRPYLEHLRNMIITTFTILDKIQRDCLEVEACFIWDMIMMGRGLKRLHLIDQFEDEGEWFRPDTEVREVGEESVHQPGIFPEEEIEYL